MWFYLSYTLKVRTVADYKSVAHYYSFFFFIFLKCSLCYYTALIHIFCLWFSES